MRLRETEKALDKYLGKNSPFQIPVSGKKTLVQWLPYIALLFGLLSILTFLLLWDSGHKVNEAASTINELGAAYGIEPTAHRLGILYYVSTAAILAQAALLLIAVPGLKSRSKPRGWDFLIYGALANLVYGVFISFTSQGGYLDFIGSLAGVVVSLYILAQIRSYYPNNKKTL